MPVANREICFMQRLDNLDDSYLNQDLQGDLNQEHHQGIYGFSIYGHYFVTISCPVF